jgi:hypothetical protein
LWFWCGGGGGGGVRWVKSVAPLYERTKSVSNKDTFLHGLFSTLVTVLGRLTIFYTFYFQDLNTIHKLKFLS